MHMYIYTYMHMYMYVCACVYVCAWGYMYVLSIYNNEWGKLMRDQGAQGPFSTHNY